MDAKRNNLRNILQIKFWLLLVFITGAVLSSVQFFGHSSMWFDELTGALNVQQHTYYQLATQPLDYNQVAPVGFLLLEKLATSLFGENDFAFRFFPWIWSLVSLLFFLEIAKYFFKGPGLVAAFILFAGSVSHWFYAGEAKQYSGDITAALFLVWSALQLMKAKIKRSTLWLIAGLGFILIVSSLPAIVIAPVVLSIIFVLLLKKDIPLSKKYFLIISISWAIACAWAVYYAKFVISAKVSGAMSAYWSEGFAPLEGFGNYFKWIYITLADELSYFLTFWMTDVIPQITIVSKVLLLLSIPGIIFLAKKYKAATLLLFSPLLVALLLATARILPFDNRVSIYATWPFIVSGIAGVAALENWLPLLLRPAVSTALKFCVALPILLITIVLPSEHPPFNAQSSQPVLQELKKQLQPGDILYVYFKARHAVHFYGPKEGITSYVTGNSYDSISSYLRELDKFKGNKRVWFFFSQWTERQTFPDSIKAYLGNVIGKEISKIPDPDGNKEDLETAAHLYDLTGKEREKDDSMGIRTNK
jgi:hypothetical protein